MDQLSGIGKLRIFRGSLLVLVGLVLPFAPKVPFLRRLPGDILMQGDGFSFYFPMVTMVLVSLLLTLLLNIIPRLFR